MCREIAINSCSCVCLVICIDGKNSYLVNPSKSLNHLFLAHSERSLAVLFDRHVDWSSRQWRMGRWKVGEVQGQKGAMWLVCGATLHSCRDHLHFHCLGNCTFLLCCLLWHQCLLESCFWVFEHVQNHQIFEDVKIAVVMCCQLHSLDPTCFLFRFSNRTLVFKEVNSSGAMMSSESKSWAL